MALFNLYKISLNDGHVFEVIAHSFKDAIHDACYIEQIQEYDIKEIKVIE